MSKELEKQKASAAAQAKRARAEAESGSNEPGGFLPFFNKKMANIAGSGVDAISGAIRNLPIGERQNEDYTPYGQSQTNNLPPAEGTTSRTVLDSIAPEDSFGGSQSIRRGMENIGAPTPNRGPETASEHMGEITAEAASTLIPVLKVGQAVTAPQKVGVAKNIAKNMSDLYTHSSKGKAALLGLGEAGAVAGSGLARDIAQENNMGPTGSLLLELAGGVGGGVAAQGGVNALRLGFAAYRKLGPSGFMPWTRKGGEVRAARYVQRLVDDKAQALKDIDKYPGLKPATATGDRELLELQKSVLDLDPRVSTAQARKINEQAHSMLQSLRGEGDPRDLAKHISDYRKSLFRYMDQSVELAEKEANAAIKRFGPKASKRDSSAAMVAAVDLAEEAATSQEDILWNAFSRELEVSHGNFSSQYKNLTKSISSSERKLIPNDAHDFIRTLRENKLDAAKALLEKKGIHVTDKAIAREAAKMKPITTINELDGQYKMLGEFIGKPGTTKGEKKIARDLREAILKDMEVIDGSELEKAKVGIARDFSRRKNKVFGDDPIGRILEKGDGGRKKMDPTLALEKTIKKGGQEGAYNQQAIAKTGTFAADEGFGISTNEAVDSVDLFLRKEFIKKSAPKGEFKQARAESFLERYDEMLEQYPETRKGIEDLMKKAEKFSNQTAEQKALSKLWSSPGHQGSKLIEGQAVNEIGKAMESLDPVAEIGKIMKTITNPVIKTDAETISKAVKGLRSAAAEWIIKKSTSKNMNIASGKSEIDGQVIARMLDDKKQRRALIRLFGLDGTRRLKGISERLYRLDLESNAKGGIDIAPDKPGVLIRFLGTWGGTKASKLGSGGSQLKLASTGSKIVDTLMNAVYKGKMRGVLKEAVDSEPLYKALLEYNTNLPKAKLINIERNLRAWMLGSGAHLFTEEELAEIKGKPRSQPATPSRPTGTPPYL